MRRSSVLVSLAIAATAAAAPDAQAKITCSGVHPAAETPLEGMPAEPVAGPEYRVSVSVPRAAHANPRPIAMFIRCREPHGDPSFMVNLPGAGEVEFPLRFSEPGRWRATLMDRGGTFHSLGSFNVSRPLAVTTDSADGAAAPSGDDGGGAAVILGAISLLGAAGAWAFIRRRRVGHLRPFDAHGDENVPG